MRSSLYSYGLADPPMRVNWLVTCDSKLFLNQQERKFKFLVFRADTPLNPDQAVNRQPLRLFPIFPFRLQ